MREDYFTNTPEDAGAYERMRSADDSDDRPTRMEAERDEADCQHLYSEVFGHVGAWPPGEPIWVCDDCGDVSS